MVRASRRTAAGTAALGLAVLVPGSGVAHAQETSDQADGTPSPTLGSTNSPQANPPGSADNDPDDWSNPLWVVLAAGVVVVLVGGGTLYLMRTRRIDMHPRSTPEDAERPEDEQQHQR